MSRSRLLNLISLLVIFVVLWCLGQPKLLEHFPLTKSDRAVIANANQFLEELSASPTTTSSVTPPPPMKATDSAVVQPTSLVIEKVTATESAVVKRVVDGDTIELIDGRTVRYIGIDTPETKHPTKGVECFGKEASAYNQQLVENKTIILEKDVSETDRYGRLLRYVWLNGELVNWRLVAEGYAFASAFPPDIHRQSVLTEAQKKARESNFGLWAVCPQ